MPQIVNADIGQGATTPERKPPIVKNDWLRAGLVGENKFDAVSSVDAFQNFERLAIEPDCLGSCLAVRQQQSRRVVSVNVV